MTKFNTAFTLSELKSEGGFGLELDANKVDQIISAGAPSHEFYLGTDVSEWLGRLTVVTSENLGEYFPTWDEEADEYDEDTPDMDAMLYLDDGDNSYNWGGNSSADINLNFVCDDQGRGFVYVAIHIGTDIRAGYTPGILIDLETYSLDDLTAYFLEGAMEASDGLDVEYQGHTYTVRGDILSEEVTVYSSDADVDAYTWGHVYTDDAKDAETELLEIVERALEDC